MVDAPLDDFVKDGLIDLCDTLISCSGLTRCGEFTLGMGMASVMACSPISSIMFLMSTERSATSRSVPGVN